MEHRQRQRSAKVAIGGFERTLCVVPMTSCLVAGIGIHLEVSVFPRASIRAHHHTQVVALIDKSLGDFHHEHIGQFARRTDLLPSVVAAEHVGHLIGSK